VAGRRGSVMLLAATVPYSYFIFSEYTQVFSFSTKSIPLLIETPYGGYWDEFQSSHCTLSLDTGDTGAANSAGDEESRNEITVPISLVTLRLITNRTPNSTSQRLAGYVTSNLGSS